MITAWRICKARHLATAFDGRGAAEHPGRWNPAGVPVVYLAESRSLASLEVLVHAEDLTLLTAIHWVAVPVTFDEALLHRPKRVPDDWRVVPVPPATREFGRAWVAAGTSVVLRVPSVVTAGEFNLLVNPRHPDFPRLKFGAPEPLAFDPRLA